LEITTKHFAGMYLSVEKERPLTKASRWDASESPPSPPPKGGVWKSLSVLCTYFASRKSDGYSV